MNGLTISRVAKATGVSPKALRYWERIGLLPKPMRSHTGYRIYGRQEIDRVTFIKKAKAAGLTLAEIAQVLSLSRERRSPCEAVLRWTDEKIERLERQIRFLREIRSRGRRQRPATPSQVSAQKAKPSETPVCSLIESVFLEEGGEKDEEESRGLHGRLSAL